MNHFCAIDRREGTVAGRGPSNLAAGADGEAGPAAKVSEFHRLVANRSLW